VVNGGVTYASRSGAGSATVLFNRVGRRLAAAGELPLPDVYDMPRDVVDLSLLFPVGVRGVSARVDARNLLDARYVLRQGAVEREAFRTGRVVQVGLAWRP
jgi:outer membrane receptor protein involved in Fe transport